MGKKNEKKLEHKKKKQKRKLTKAVEAKKKKAQLEKAKTQECLHHFNMAVLLKLLKEMAGVPEEGIWLNNEAVQAVVQNVYQVVSLQSQQMLQHLQAQKDRGGI